VEVVLDLPCLLLLLDEPDLLLNGGLHFVHFLEVLLYLPDLTHHVLVEVHYFLFEAVVVAKDVLRQER
jgi:hypothetical protein